MTRRSVAVAAAAAAMMVAGLAPALAADFPSKPITIVVPYPPGGSTDLVSRVVGQKIGQQLKQPVVVENKPGASEQIAASQVKRAPADGHTIMLITMTGMSVNPGLYGSKLPYDPQKDFVPIIHAVTVPSVIAVNPGVPARHVGELTEYFRHTPGATYASAGNGTPSHLGMEMYKRLTKTSAAHVPYKGGAPALQDVMAGQVPVMMALASEAMPMVKAGKLKALALTTLKRSPRYPDLPTASEAGLKGFELLFWYAFVAPAGTPPEVVHKLNAAINAALQDKEVNGKLSEIGLEVEGGSPAKVAELSKRDAAKWQKLIKEAGISIE
jgi:tripartite-type tricarboxylate transporter receptor subunit TctC